MDAGSTVRSVKNMVDEIKVKNTTLRLMKGDITDMQIDCFVFYARNDLALGSGFGTAITVRGGSKIQEELKAMGKVNTTEAVISSGGNMKARYIIHAVGPKFQEEDLEKKLHTTMVNVLKLAEQKDIKSLAFPAMGVGFYGISLPTCAQIMLTTIMDYLNGQTKLENLVVCLLDSREYKPFQQQMNSLVKSDTAVAR